MLPDLCCAIYMYMSAVCAYVHIGIQLCMWTYIYMCCLLFLKGFGKLGYIQNFLLFKLLIFIVLWHFVLIGLFFVLLLFLDSVSLCNPAFLELTVSPGESQSHRDLPASVSPVLGLKVCASMGLPLNLSVTFFAEKLRQALIMRS